MKIICLILGFTILWAPGAEAIDFKFPEITGWKQAGEIQVFSPSNLYNHINGAADLYLAYAFRELKVAEYQNEKKASMIVEIYRHHSPYNAFGIYSQERPAEGNFLNVGAQGYSESDILNFVAGNYYVKINSFKTGPEGQVVLLTFAKKVVENLGEKGPLPPILSSFPQEGKKDNSEKFISQNFLGYSFLHSAFTADYDLSGKKFKLFVIEGAEQKTCRDMLQAYLQRTGNSQIKLAEGRFTLKDSYHGEMDFYWKGKYIWGTLNLDDSALRSKYISLFGESLEKK